MAFICGYCRQKKEYASYIEGKERPYCATCNRENITVKDDPNNPYSLTAKIKRGEINDE